MNNCLPATHSTTGIAWWRGYSYWSLHGDPSSFFSLSLSFSVSHPRVQHLCCRSNSRENLSENTFGRRFAPGLLQRVANVRHATGATGSGSLPGWRAFLLYVFVAGSVHSSRRGRVSVFVCMCVR